MSNATRLERKREWLPYLVGGFLVTSMIAVFTSIVIWQEFRNQRQASETFTQNTTIMLAHHIGGIFDEADVLLQAVDFRYRDQQARGTFHPQNFNDFLIEALNWAPEFSNVGFIDAKGIYRFGREFVEPVSLADREYFVRLKERPAFSGSGPMIFSSPIFTLMSKRWALVLARRVENPDGSFGGIVFLRWDVDRLSALFEAIKIGSQGTIVLRNSEMQQVNRYPAATGQDTGPGNQKVSRDLRDLLKQFPEGQTYRTVSTLDNTERIYSYRKVEQYPFYVIAGQEIDLNFWSWGSNIKLTLALGSLMILMTIVVSRHMFRQNRKRIRQQLDNFAERVLSASPVAMFLLDKENIIKSTNPAAERLFGHSHRSMIGMSAARLKASQQFEDTSSQLYALATSSARTREVIYVREDGTSFTALQSISMIPNIDGSVSHFIETVVDISDLKQTQERLRRQAETDKLTGLLNRHSGELALHQPVTEALNSHASFSLVMCDIDHFKRANDQFGHPVGDLVLMRVAAVMKAAVRGGDYCIRWGGEEFLIVLPGCSGAVACSLAERIRIQISEMQNDEVGQVTMSFGVAQWDKHETVDALIARSDQALYQAKQTGRNRVCFA